jgi:hypothetical protein
MEAYKKEDDELEELEEASSNGKIYETIEATRSKLMSWIGIIIAILGFIVVFGVASIDGTKEVKASKSDSGKILNIWRKENNVGVGIYPEEQSDIIQYKNHEYYFVIDSIDETTKEIVKWHFAYDGGINYIFQDYKFYVLVGITFIISMYVGFINYSQAVRSVKSSKSFKKTLTRYQNLKNKESVKKTTQYIPDFCIYKNKQAYEIAKREIVEDAEINYDFYMSKEFDKSKLEKWQIKKLNEIRRIKIDRLRSADLLQEQGNSQHKFLGIGSIKVRLLPMSQKEHQVKFLISGGFQKIITSALGGLTFGFGIALGNWTLGAMMGFTVIASYFTSIIVGTDFANSTLKNRYISKGDYLIEFDNIKDMFIPIDTTLPREDETKKDGQLYTQPIIEEVGKNG